MRKELIEQMVSNYNAQVKIVKRYGAINRVTLREYLEGIKAESNVMTQEEVEYGISVQAFTTTPDAEHFVVQAEPG